ncbi:hypothetical protein K7432_015242 [Basidiobolus ranarum]|uniref:feruloyl esterase n=1 Tax=Basidiobolus ranarum TaxID=34480 RepID=A0ABR2VP99_9FUNG
MFMWLKNTFSKASVSFLLLNKALLTTLAFQQPFQQSKYTPLVAQTIPEFQSFFPSWLKEDFTGLEPGDYVFNFTDDLIRGQPREFLVHVPEMLSHDGSKIPIFFGLHGMGDSPENFAHGTGMNLASDTHKFLAVYPKGSALTVDSTSYTWNAGTCCLSKGDDIKFLNRVMRYLIDSLGEERVDFDRIFTLGFSAGGAMSYSWACHNNGLGIDEDGAPLVKFRGIAPMSGSMAGNCDHKFNSNNAFSIAHFHGTSDPLFPYRYKLYLPIGYKIRTALDTINFWSNEKFHCKSSSIGYHNGTVTQHVYQDCLDHRVRVSLVETQRGKHSWPPAEYVNASDFIWRYFNERDSTSSS